MDEEKILMDEEKMTCVLIEQENQAMSTTLNNKEQKDQFQCKTILSSQLILWLKCLHSESLLLYNIL